MEASLLERVQTSCLCRVPAAVGVYKGTVVVATPACCTKKHGLSKEDIQLRFHQLHGSTECVHLSGHSSQVSILSFSSGPATLLCSASKDEILLWDLEQCSENETSGIPFGRLQLDCSSCRDSVNHICFSEDSHYVAVCRGQETLIFQTKTCHLDTTLVGHTARVTCAVFSPHFEQSHTIITASEDRTYKIWDLSNSSLIYQSPVISASPFLCIAVALHGNLLATGTADGVLRIFDLSEGPGRHACLHKCDVMKELEKWLGPYRDTKGDTESMIGGQSVIQSTPSWRASHDNETSEEKDYTSVEMGPAIFDLYYWPQGEEQQPQLLSHVSGEVLKEPPVLLVATHQGLLQFNSHTLQLMDVVDFKEPLYTSQRTDYATVPAIATCDFVYSSLEDEVCCCLGAMFSGDVLLLRLTKTQSTINTTTAQLENVDKETVDGTIVSVLSSTPLVPNSPLKAEFSLKSKTASVVKKSSATRVSHPTKALRDQPLTFKSKVKSSGYSEAPRMKMFQSPKASTTHSRKSTATHTSSDKKKSEYPLLCEPTAHPFHSMRLSERHSPIYHSCFNGSGQYLTCASADKIAYAVKMPTQSDKIHSFVGHDGAVLSVHWSHSGEWLLTSSADRTARIWTIGHKDPLLTIDTISNNFKSAEKETKANVPFSKEISCAQFYYLDKFFLLTSGNSLYLYKYHIDTTKPDDIKRYQTNSRYKLVSSFAVESAQSITAMSSISDFHSYIVLLGASNKMIEVYDMNAERSIRTMAEVHSRSVCCIYQNKGSKYVTHPPAAYDLFLTSAVTDGIKLWDLRTNRCVHKFSSHSNPSLPVSATISPCARFIATGSEDRAAYIYDIRSASPLHKLRGHSDVVSSVTYHPLKPILATSTLDGQIRLFSDRVL